MLPKSPHALKNMLHPYIFVLKEGKEIKTDYLDYTLMMLFVHSNERLGASDATPFPLPELPF